MKAREIVKYLAIIIVAVVMNTGIAHTVLATVCVKAADSSGIQIKTLYAGQSINTGAVSVLVNGDNLYVVYETTDGWELMEAHLWIGSDLAGMPQTRKGNPKVGNFPYHSGDISGQTSYTFSISLADIGFVQNSDGSCEVQTFFAAAHAVLRKGNGDSTYQTETGWANGERIVEKGNWATYFSFDLTCNCDNSNGSCETAFAYNDINGICFIGADFDNDGQDDGFTRWGWSIGSLSEGDYTYDIYAAAGQCDITKGTLVGQVTINYNAGTAYIQINTNQGYTMNETHLYIGSEPLARDINNEFTVAPGQYPYIHYFNNSTSDSFTIEGLSGEIYIVLHAVTCGNLI
jgi:hypothetical protein